MNKAFKMLRKSKDENSHADTENGLDPTHSEIFSSRGCDYPTEYTTPFVPFQDAHTYYYPVTIEMLNHLVIKSGCYG